MCASLISAIIQLTRRGGYGTLARSAARLCAGDRAQQLLRSIQACPTKPGKNLAEIFDAAAKGKMGAMLIVGANPVAKLEVDAKTLKKTFIIAGSVSDRDRCFG